MYYNPFEKISKKNNNIPVKYIALNILFNDWGGCPYSETCNRRVSCSDCKRDAFAYLHDVLSDKDKKYKKLVDDLELYKKAFDMAIGRLANRDINALDKLKNDYLKKARKELENDK